MNKIVHYADFVDAIRSFFWEDTQGLGREIQRSTHRAIKSFPPTNFGGDFCIYLLPISFCSLMMMTTMVRLLPFHPFQPKIGCAFDFQTLLHYYYLLRNALIQMRRRILHNSVLKSYCKL